jgi:hypothetical protein
MIRLLTTALAAAGLWVCAVAAVVTPQSTQPAAPEPPQAGPPAGTAAKLIVLRAPDAGDTELGKMAAALGAMKGVIRAAPHASEKCVSILARMDSPVTVDRAKRYLELAGYHVEEADEAAIQSAPPDASGACCASSAPAAETSKAPALAELNDLKRSLDVLRERFNADKDRPRIVALLSPL